MANEETDAGSLLGQGSDFKGKLTFLGTVRVEGVLEGEIFSEDTLVVATGAKVRGRIEVGTLIITGGRVDADVVARTAVEIHPGGRLAGEVTTPVFQIERGAIFEGNSKMPDDASRDEQASESKDPVTNPPPAAENP